VEHGKRGAAGARSFRATAAGALARGALLMRIWVIFMLLAVTIMVAAGLTEYSVRKGYCNRMGADITRAGRKLWCTNGIQPPPVDWGRLLGF
jgi:hypothetical protein